jgi:hypothetical protein
MNGSRRQIRGRLCGEGVRDVGVAGSNPATPTNFPESLQSLTAHPKSKPYMDRFADRMVRVGFRVPARLLDGQRRLLEIRIR